MSMKPSDLPPRREVVKIRGLGIFSEANFTDGKKTDVSPGHPEVN